MASARALLGLTLRWALALALGAGPLGAEVAGALVHAQVCTCTGCVPAEEAAGSCCERRVDEREGTRVDRDPDACACAIARSTEAPVKVERACAASGTTRCFRPERAPRNESAWALARVPPRTSGRERLALDTGPPGCHRAHGAARASALRVLRI